MAAMVAAAREKSALSVQTVRRPEMTVPVSGESLRVPVRTEAEILAWVIDDKGEQVAFG